MPKVVISGQKGLVQSSGKSSGLGLDGGTDSSQLGVYTYVREVDFEGTSITATDNGLVKTVAKLPSVCKLLRCFLYTSEVFDSDDEKGLDLVSTAADLSASTVAADDAITEVTSWIAATEYKSSASGALGTFVEIAASGATVLNANKINGTTGEYLCFINTDGSNDPDVIQTGKVTVFFEYVGNGPATDVTTV